MFNFPGDKPVTQKQVKLLLSLGCTLQNVEQMTTKEAHKLIERRLDRPTEKQFVMLRRFRVDESEIDHMTKDEATTLIGSLVEHQNQRSTRQYRRK